MVGLMAAGQLKLVANINSAHYVALNRHYTFVFDINLSIPMFISLY